MKLIFGFLFIVTLFEGNFASSATVPNTLLNLGGSLSGVYQTYLNNVNDLINACNSINNLNVSATLTSSSISLLTVLKKIQRFSGKLDVVRTTFYNSLPNFFDIINQCFLDFEYAVGPSINEILLEVLGIVEGVINSLASADLSNTKIAIINLVNCIEYILLTTDILIISFADDLNDDYADFFINAVITTDTLFALAEYAIFLNAPIATDAKAIKFINILASPVTQIIGSSAQLISGATSNAKSQSSLTANIDTAIPQYVLLTFNFIHAVATIPNSFDNYRFTYQSLPEDLNQIRVAFDRLGITIGNHSGSDIYDIITSELS